MSTNPAHGVTIAPSTSVGSWRQATIYADKKAIEKILGFAPNNADDEDKVKYSWTFTLNGEPAAIWDYKGSWTIREFSAWGPRELLQQVFGSAFRWERE